MTRLLLLVLILLATLIIVFPAQMVAFLSGGPAWTLLGVSLIVLAHQLRRRSNKAASRHAHGH